MVPVAMPPHVTVVRGKSSHVLIPQAITVAPVPMRVPELAPIVPGMPIGQAPAFHAAHPFVPSVAERAAFTPHDPVASVSNELDMMNARLAKIQLEKRDLPSALALIRNIRSDTFKVRTLVDLTEYVSRDQTYQREAEQLYRLAVAGIEALSRGQAVRID